MALRLIKIIFQKIFWLMVNSPRQVLLQIACSRKALFTELTLPRLVFVVNSVNVHSHVVASHEHLVALKGFKINIFYDSDFGIVASMDSIHVGKTLFVNES